MSILACAEQSSAICFWWQRQCTVPAFRWVTSPWYYDYRHALWPAPTTHCQQCAQMAQEWFWHLESSAWQKNASAIAQTHDQGRARLSTLLLSRFLSWFCCQKRENFLSPRPWVFAHIRFSPQQLLYPLTSSLSACTHTGVCKGTSCAAQRLRSGAIASHDPKTSRKIKWSVAQKFKYVINIESAYVVLTIYFIPPYFYSFYLNLGPNRHNNKIVVSIQICQNFSHAHQHPHPSIYININEP